MSVLQEWMGPIGGQLSVVPAKAWVEDWVQNCLSMKQATEHFHKQVKTNNLSKDDYLWFKDEIETTNPSQIAA
jgi:hypothetical protein